MARVKTFAADTLAFWLTLGKIVIDVSMAAGQVLNAVGVDLW